MYFKPYTVLSRISGSEKLYLLFILKNLIILKIILPFINKNG